MIGIIVSWLVIKTGVLVRIRAGVEARQPHPCLAVLAVVAADSLIEWMLMTP